MAWTHALVGCGSIGKRHLRNLLELGEQGLLGVDSDPVEIEETGP